MIYSYILEIPAGIGKIVLLKLASFRLRHVHMFVRPESHGFYLYVFQVNGAACVLLCEFEGDVATHRVVTCHLVSNGFRNWQKVGVGPM